MKRTILAVIPILMISCTTTPTGKSHETKISRHVEGYTIYAGSSPHAELVTIGQFADRDSYRGIAIYYFGFDQFEWISPEHGWALEDASGEIIFEIKKLQKIWVEEPWRSGYMV